MQQITTKGITRKYRKALAAAAVSFPLTGAFHIKVGGKLISDHNNIPGTAVLKRSKVDIVNAPAGSIIDIKPAPKPAPTVTSEDRALFKRIVREADPTKPNSKRRIDYRLAKNPKADDGVTYYAKINGKWRDVPAAYADPSYTLAGEAVAV
jgi:hypothetical protein